MPSLIDEIVGMINNGRLTFKAILFLYCLYVSLLWLGEKHQFFLTFWRK